MDKKKFELLKFTELNKEEMIEQSQRFYENMKRRRTVREFSDRPIPGEVINNAISAAGTAPSGANKQPWHFCVITNSATKKKIRIAAEKEEHAFYHDRAPAEWLDALSPFGTNEIKPFLEKAPCLIIVFLKRSIVDENGINHKTYYPNESVGIATGILLTALHLSGLVTLTHTPSPMKFLNDVLGRPDNERPFLIVVTGYPDKNAQVPKLEKHTLDQISTFDRHD